MDRIRRGSVRGLGSGFRYRLCCRLSHGSSSPAYDRSCDRFEVGGPIRCAKRMKPPLRRPSVIDVCVHVSISLGLGHMRALHRRKTNVAFPRPHNLLRIGVRIRMPPGPL